MSKIEKRFERPLIEDTLIKFTLSKVIWKVNFENLKNNFIPLKTSENTTSLGKILEKNCTVPETDRAHKLQKKNFCLH